MAFFERYPFKTPLIEFLQPIFSDWVFRLDNDLFGLDKDLIEVLTPEDRTWLAELLKPIRVYASEYEMPLSEKSKKLFSEVLLRIEERLGREWLSQALYNLTFPGLSEELDDSSMALRLVLRLNLVNFRAPQETPTPEQVLGAFMSRYGLSELRPERRLMYRVIKHLIPLQDRDRIRDPLEFHALRLLQAYALEVLPEDEREPERVSHPVLGILGQTDLFPVRDTLEAWTGMRVRLEGPDRWRLFKGRKLWGELTYQQAYRAAALLRSMAQPFHTLEENRYGPGISLGWLADKKEAPPRVAYPLERALEALAAPTPPFEGKDPRMRFWSEQRHAAERLFAELEKHAVARDK